MRLNVDDLGLIVRIVGVDLLVLIFVARPIRYLRPRATKARRTAERKTESIEDYEKAVLFG